MRASGTVRGVSGDRWQNAGLIGLRAGTLVLGLLLPLGVYGDDSDDQPLDSDSTSQDADLPTPVPETPKQDPEKKADSPAPVTQDANEDSTQAADAFPAFEDVQKAVSAQLATAKDYKPGDMLTDRSVAPVFKKLDEMGWAVADRKQIEKQLVPDSDWLSRQFRTPDGRKFMRRIAKFSAAYDRVDRLRRMPRGERQVLDLIRGADGHKLVEYMTTTNGGKNLGKQLSHGKQADGFNRPTGRLYTEKNLLDRLKQGYDAEVKRREKKS